jgi:hypothetical protein
MLVTRGSALRWCDLIDAKTLHNPFLRLSRKS